jgi:hypothetical protein
MAVLAALSANARIDTSRSLPPLWGRVREGGSRNGSARGYPPLQLSLTRGERADRSRGARSAHPRLVIC